MGTFINPAGKLFRHPERLAAWQAREPFAPIGMELDLTNRCNLGCSACHFGYTHSRGPLSRESHDEMLADMGDEMDLALLERLVPELHAAGVQSVTLSGGGEPTLYPHFVRAIHLVRENNLALGLYTNGTRVNPSLAADIRTHCSWVVVSLDEAARMTYRARKKVDGFGAACEGVRALANVDGDAIIGLSFLIHEKNAADLDRMVELRDELGADYVEFRPAVFFDLAHPDKPKMPADWIEHHLPRLEWWSKQPRVEVPLGKFERYARWASYGRGYSACHAVLFTGIVTPNGKLWTCVNRRGFPDSCLGDLSTESFDAVWTRVKPQFDLTKCRVLCRGDALNLQLVPLANPLPHEEFI